jgi:hypothetical protein
MVTHQIGFEGFRQPAQRSSWPNSAESEQRWKRCLSCAKVLAVRHRLASFTEFNPDHGHEKRHAERAGAWRLGAVWTVAAAP